MYLQMLTLHATRPLTPPHLVECLCFLSLPPSSSGCVDFVVLADPPPPVMILLPPPASPFLTVHVPNNSKRKHKVLLPWKDAFLK